MKECIWLQQLDPDREVYWQTSCGRAFVLTEGGPEDNHYNYCPSCGGKIKEVKV